MFLLQNGQAEPILLAPKMKVITNSIFFIPFVLQSNHIVVYRDHSGLSVDRLMIASVSKTN
jgi:hypothetical protein